jgi:DUF4097 and DUF4098 domain-containing protein YvlB/F0F1-type ATP synthase membrane subunit b/b'
MVKKVLELGEQPHVVVEQVAGNLNVKGWKRNEVLLKTSCQDDLRFEQSGDALYIECPEDCILYAPHGAAIEVNQVGGGAGFKSLAGKLKINLVGGQLSLRDVGAVDAKSIGAGLTAKGIRGDLTIDSVGGNANARDVDGQFHCDSIGGSLRLRDISGGISATAGGSARVDLSPVPWQAYAISAGGNIRCNVPEDLNADISFDSGTQSIRIKLPSQSLTIKEGNHQQEFGEGGTPISLKSGSKIILVGLSSDWAAADDDMLDMDVDLGENISSMVEDITRQTTEHISAHLGELDSHLSELSTSLEDVGLSEERSQEIQQRLEQARQRATQRAEDAAQRAQGKLERKLAAAQRKMAREARRSHQKSVSIDVDAIRASARKANDPVSDEERMLILQMLQEGQVSVDQADELLAALDGK